MQDNNNPLDNTNVSNGNLNNNVTNPVDNNLNPAPSFFNNNNVINNTNIPQPQINVDTNNKKFKINFKFTKKIKTILAIVLAAVVVLIVGLIIKSVFFNNNPKNMESLERIFSTSNPIAVKKDKKYGFITSEGKDLIIPEYDGVTSDFYGDFAVVYKKSSKATDDQFFVIDKNNNTKASVRSREDIVFSPKYETWVIKGKLYNRNLKQISDDSKIISSFTKKDSNLLEFEDKTDKSVGFMDSTGKIIYTYKYLDGELSFNLSSHEIDASIKECYVVVSVNSKKFAIINCNNGKTVYDFTNNTITNEGNNIFTIYESKPSKKRSYVYIAGDKIAYQNDDSNVDGLDYLYIDKTKKQILKIGYTKGEDKYYDIGSKTLLDSKPEGLGDSLSLEELSAGLTTFTCSGGNKGIMMDGKIIIPCEYKDMSFLPIDLFNYVKAKTGNGLVLLEREETTDLINVYDKKVIKTFNSNILSGGSDSTFLKASLNDEAGTEVYNLLSKKEMTFKHDATVSVYSNYIVVSENKGKIKTYYNTDLKEIYKETL